METRQKTQSIIAKLMGLEETPSQPIRRQQKVLSENYLQKSSSIGKRSSNDRQNRLLLSKKRTHSKTNGLKKYASLAYGEQRSSFRSGQDTKNASSPSLLLDSRSTFAWETKKQLLERSKMTKVCQTVHRSSQNNDSAIKLPIFKSLSFSSDPATKFRRITRSEVKLISKKRENCMTSNVENCRFDSNPSSPISVSSDANMGTEGVEFSHAAAQKSDPTACSCSSKEYFSDLSSGQDSSVGSHEDSLISSDSIQIDEELRKNLGEVYQPRPDSVLEPLFKEDDSSCSEHSEPVSTNLQGLWTQLELLKSESDENRFGPEPSASVDEPSRTGQTAKSTTKESRELSYLADVLDESGFHGGHVGTDFSSPSVFETLEKKHAKRQEPWTRAERWLLFDRINEAVAEIQRPLVDTRIHRKPLRRKMGAFLKRDVVEGELWTLLLGQGTEVNAHLSEKAVGKERWLDSDSDSADEVDSVVREIEFFLFDELAGELV